VSKFGLRSSMLMNMKNWKKDDYLNAYCDLKHPEVFKV
jgi:hypothetical protein